jgi:uncharacterized protein (UPF0210 family)
MNNDKTLFMANGQPAGDDIMNKSAEKFINRGGRIPAPIHGNKN